MADLPADADLPAGAGRAAPAAGGRPEPEGVGAGWAAAPGAPVVAEIRFAVPGAAAADFPAAARAALDALARAAGFRSGRLARALDEPASWLLTTEWDGPGPWRRALSAFEVRYALTPLLVHAVDVPGAFEVLAAVDPPVARGAGRRDAERGGSGPADAGSGARTYRSDRAADADTAAPRRR
ncbi:antibiotic biosynthesis monooxygenase [Frankia sp. QA3]|uniref:antibiotic biosynthesis monooxygenase n=1 Tax=Frankia sp. QA3 TaxID=710111 RepID=UPI000269C374|nr:antibiotic biosynthesis monooxygenase [Frankia sp. QA3]EIV93335.1 Antibiotic biosynthesis monooxygenase [Frankia sp. QA3]